MSQDKIIIKCKEYIKEMETKIKEINDKVNQLQTIFNYNKNNKVHIRMLNERKDVLNENINNYKEIIFLCV